jgi:mono/diheme cytochrome c family protein
MKRLFAMALVSVLAVGCGDDDATGDDDDDQIDAGDDDDDTIDAGGDDDDDAGGPDGGDNPAVARGQYITEHVAVCVECHTPRTETGALDETKWFAGNPAFADLDPQNEEEGLVPTPNLTPHETGLAEWTDDEIKEAFLNGVDRDGNALFPIMPYYVFHNMTEEDADAVVAYLRTLTAVDNAIPDRQPLGFPFDTPSQPIPADDLPDSTLPEGDENYELAQQGKYLAANIGICMECHTPQPAEPGPFARDLALLFAGGEAFPAEQFGLPVPPFPDTIYSRNLTPDATGIEGWTAEQVRTVLKEGTDLRGQGVCPPMPSGPMGAFGGLTDEDALAIGVYLTTLEPIANEIPNDCTLP